MPFGFTNVPAARTYLNYIVTSMKAKEIHYLIQKRSLPNPEKENMWPFHGSNVIIRLLPLPVQIRLILY